VSGRPPTVFLSSTFYDLRQVRTNLVRFLEDELDYRALASEYPSFPVDPDADTVENCRRRVEQDVDVLVLVVGGRYGSIPRDQDASVTNIEYTAARAKGIPIYAFVLKEVLALLPVWRKNPDGNFDGVVDTPRLFDFIEQFRTKHGVWTFEFERAQEIVGVLRRQFAYVAMRGLDYQRRFRGRERELEGLTGRSLRLAAEAASGWAGRLFAQVLADEVARLRDMRTMYSAEATFGTGEYIPQLAAPQWFVTRMQESLRQTSSMNRLFDLTINKALGGDDPSEIASQARVLAQAYRAALEWCLALRRAHFDDDDWTDIANEAFTHAS
jgi:hypothetical protein